MWYKAVRLTAPMNPPVVNILWFQVFNRHGEELFGAEEMNFTHRQFTFTTYLSCLNDDTNKMFTSLPNLEHDLGIDNNDIDNPISLSNTLF